VIVDSTRLRRAAGIVALLTAGFALSASAGETLRARPLLERVRSRMAGEAGLIASFVQVSEWAALAETDSSRGTLTVAPSGRFRLDYTRPPGQRIGCDGSFVWTYVPEERQVLRARMKETTGWGGFFLESLAEPVDSLARVDAVPGRGEVARIALRPQPEWGLATLFVEIEVAGGMPVGYGYTDEDGNRIRFRFSTARFVDTIPDTLFRFSLPAGYEIFDAD
jgi:outer membrane lipoprotein-sorting protein